MDKFSSTEEAITLNLTDFAIRSNAKQLVFEKVNSFESHLWRFSHDVAADKAPRLATGSQDLHRLS